MKLKSLICGIAVLAATVACAPENPDEKLWIDDFKFGPKK